MRSSNTNRNVLRTTGMIIREDDDEEEYNMSRNAHYPRLTPAIHFSRSSIIRTHEGERSFVIN
jgi:hypothetical protein